MITDAEYVLHGALGAGAIRNYAKERSGWVVDAIARTLVASLPEQEIRLFAEAYVRDEVDQWRRHEARRVEEAAECEEATVRTQILSQAELEWRRQRAVERAEREERRLESDARLYRKLAELVKEHDDQIRLEVTTELLNSVFALGDGTRVTWGDATVEQHQQRIDLLTGMAAGTLETAARHHAAISMLEEAGATCLKQLTPVAA